ncbi:MAG TPA: hypothetical protein VJZ27_16695, partial [Aggregatilineales bacterium]|nr:hypothetical protein [Aggregatilineales bacterium]
MTRVVLKKLTKGELMQPDWILNIKQITVHPIAMPLVSPFETSFGTQTLRGIVLVRVETAGGAVGWGEVTTDFDPGYSYETSQTAIHILNDYLVPRLMQVQPLHSDKRWVWLESVRGHPLAKHGLISAILTAAAAELQMSLAEMLTI